jgi:hypothetical protein
MSQSARHRQPRPERAPRPQPSRDSLPKWAQRELHQLEGQVEHWKQVATAGTDQAGDSTTYLVSYGGPDRAAERGLGMDPMIRFRLAGGAYIEAHLSRDYDGLKLRSNPGALLVRPEVSNAVIVGVEPL